MRKKKETVFSMVKKAIGEEPMSVRKQRGQYEKLDKQSAVRLGEMAKMLGLGKYSQKSPRLLEYEREKNGEKDNSQSI